MAELNNSGTGQWSETDASNTSASPDGWPTGTYANQVEANNRASMGALKRFWDRINGTVTTTGTSSAYVYTPANTSYPTAYVSGEVYRPKFHTANASGGVTLNINGLGAKSIKLRDGTDPAANQINGFHSVAYDGTNLVLLDPIVDTAIADGSITLAKMADLAANKLIGRATASTGVPEALGLGYGLEMDATNTKLVFLGAIQGGFKNLKISTSDGSTAPVVTADQVTVENSSGYSQRLSSLSVTMDLTGTGAGKLDTGTIATSTWYYIWAIAKDDGTKSTLASTSSTAPTLPSGYTYKARLGAVRTKSSSAVFLGSVQYGKRVQYTGLQPTMDSGLKGSSGSAGALQSVAVANFIPTTAGRIQGIVSVPSGGYIAVAAPSNSYNAYNAGSGRPPVGASMTGLASGTASILFDFTLESTSIYWASNNAGGELLCLGWEDNL